jgi:hypothetical protein
MNRLGMMVAVTVFLSVTWVHAQKVNATEQGASSDQLQPSPEMRKLFDAFAGSWQVGETFEVSTERRGKTRQGTASFRSGPGYSLIEEYRSTGSAGSLSFLALLWWDPPAHIYRLLTCANDDGCQLRGTARWEGKELVNSWEEDVGGKIVKFRDSFVDFSPSSFRLVSEGTADDRTIWRVITRYQRPAQSSRQ